MHPGRLPEAWCCVLQVQEFVKKGPQQMMAEMVSTG